LAIFISRIAMTLWLSDANRAASNQAFMMLNKGGPHIEGASGTPTPL
jgi:hypothetical protein